MKVTNHHKENYHYCGDDSSVMYGSITMTLREWSNVKDWLQVRYNNAKRNDETYQRDSLKHTIDYSLPKAELAILQNECFSIGVEATRLMFGAYGLKGYKRQNYSINII